jgi:hypothetical protein
MEKHASKLAFGVMVLGALAFTGNPLTVETLVQTSPTLLLAPMAGATSAEVYNAGPNTIGCALGGGSTDGGGPSYVDGGGVLQESGGRPIGSGASWSISSALGVVPQIWCTASTANQVAGAGTIVSEVP